MISKPSASAVSATAQRLGQATGLVELDVDGVVALAQRGEGSTIVHALVRRRSGTPWTMRSRCASSSAGSGCSMRATPGRDAGRHLDLEVCRRPGLIGIDDEHRVGSGRANGGDTILVAVTGELDLEQRVAKPHYEPASAMTSGRSTEIVKAVVAGAERGQAGALERRHARCAWHRSPTRRNRPRCGRRRRAEDPAAAADPGAFSIAGLILSMLSRTLPTLSLYRA